MPNTVDRRAVGRPPWRFRGGPADGLEVERGWLTDEVRYPAIGGGHHVYRRGPGDSGDFDFAGHAPPGAAAVDCYYLDSMGPL